MPCPLARSAFVAERIAGDVFVRFFLSNLAPFLADHQRDLALVIELLRYARPHQWLARADERARRAEEHAGIFRLGGAVLVLLVAVGVVHADAENLFRKQDGTQ